MQSIIEECAQVLRTRFTSPQLSRDALEEHVGEVIRSTAANWSSMVQDVRSNRGSTEIDLINGTIVHWGRAAGVPTPVNSQLVDAIHQLQQYK